MIRTFPELNTLRWGGVWGGGQAGRQAGRHQAKKNCEWLHFFNTGVNHNIYFFVGGGVGNHVPSASPRYLILEKPLYSLAV